MRSASISQFGKDWNVLHVQLGLTELVKLESSTHSVGADVGTLISDGGRVGPLGTL